MPDYHIHMGETFYLIEKITSPTHNANFALLICSVCRGINTILKHYRIKFLKLQILNFLTKLFQKNKNLATCLISKRIIFFNFKKFSSFSDLQFFNLIFVKKLKNAIAYKEKREDPKSIHFNNCHLNSNHEFMNHKILFLKT